MTNDKQPQVGSVRRHIEYDEDGKPCRSCNTYQDFQLATGKIASAASATQDQVANIEGSKTYKKVEPPDIQELGRASWTMLHTMTARYPEIPTEQNKTEMKQFLNIFSHVYPCNWCARDFEKYIKENAPRVESREELGRWMCEAHNSVNRKLEKEQFDCNLWKKRWKDGWDE